MLETLRSWLNGTREYYTGVAIYSQAGSNEDLLQVLKKGPNDFRIKRLQEELLEICNKLKKANEGISTNATRIPGMERQKKEDVSEKQNHTHTESEDPINESLYAACKLEADQQYKKVMNDRAVLFSLAKTEDFEDPNTSEKIAARVRLSLDVVQGHQLTSQLYDKADYVKLHGRLPDSGEAHEENEYDHLADHLVKLRLDNARKAYNKLKAKEASPDRIALMQKHEINIQKLEIKWHSLRPE